jgi:hypothetical protein
MNSFAARKLIKLMRRVLVVPGPSSLSAALVAGFLLLLLYRKENAFTQTWEWGGQ